MNKNCKIDKFLALKIHLSSATAEILKTFKEFQLDCRGEIEVKVCRKPFDIYTFLYR